GSYPRWGETATPAARMPATRWSWARVWRRSWAFVKARYWNSSVEIMMKTLAGLLKPGVVALLLLCAGCASNRGGDDFTERYEQAGKYYRSGLYSDAERLLLDLHRRSPNHYEVLFRLGNIY